MTMRLEARADAAPVAVAVRRLQKLLKRVFQTPKKRRERTLSRQMTLRPTLKRTNLAKVANPRAEAVAVVLAVVAVSQRG
jgi:hypothetical protein